MLLVADANIFIDMAADGLTKQLFRLPETNAPESDELKKATGFPK